MDNQLRRWATLLLACLVLFLLDGCIDPFAAPQPTPVPLTLSPEANAAVTSTATSQTARAVSATRTVITPTANSQPAAAASPNLVFTLLADGRLLTVNAGNGAIVKDNRLIPGQLTTPVTGAPTTVVPAHYLALDKDGKRLFVLMPSDKAEAGRVAVVDVATSALQAVYPLAEPGTSYHSLTVGPITGRIYLFGNQNKSAVVTVLDSASGVTLASWPARGSDDHNWRIYAGAVSADERQLFISYHGEDSTGVDLFALTAAGLQRCGQSPVSDRFGCLGGHGGFVLYGNDLLVATGSNIIEQVDMQGRVTGAFDTGLTDNHLMEFVVDEPGGKLYAVGPCDYSGGFSTVDLNGGGVLTTPTVPGEWAWITTPQPADLAVPPPSALCGDRLALVRSAAGLLLVVGQTTRAVNEPGAMSALLFIDPQSGQVERTVPTHADPLDVLAIP